ncbi:hypothetical protein HWD35_21495 [Tsukamurella tyrosinosolvens]|uniref:hypothetical protein n=1 Tax=Tsukamurella tyrosinosolvens TaxID=57704 RepID=UPI001CE10DEE|nr:hypothetical protein [Tsukamurella tyrosinosolvens]MCA4997302.1 hypothetical protein [Tsukamurella tyrosinosolvens]
MSDSIVTTLQESTSKTIEETPPPVTPPTSDVKQPVAVPLASKWPWVATFAIGVLLLLAYFLFRVWLWKYVTGHDEAAETEDFQQLKDIVASADAIVVLVIGAIFGVSGGQGIAAASTAAAEKNGKVAEENADVARQGHAIAEQNRQAAVGAVKVAENVVTALHELALVREHDSSQFLRRYGEGLTIAKDDMEPVDPRLADLAEAAQAAVEQLKSKVDHR